MLFSSFSLSAVAGVGFRMMLSAHFTLKVFVKVGVIVKFIEINVVAIYVYLRCHLSGGSFGWTVFYRGIGGEVKVKVAFLECHANISYKVGHLGNFSFKE